MDFMRPDHRFTKQGRVEIYPRFVINNHSKDLMIRGGDFYAIWVEDLGIWSTDEQDCLKLIDNALDEYAKEHTFDTKPSILYMWDAGNGMIDNWHKYCQRQSRDNYHALDEKLIFSNDPTRKDDYASKRLSYPLEPGEHIAYDNIMSVLYSPDERDKIEWAIGAIVAGESKNIQKFLVFYGAPKTGKSTILNIIEQLFAGYFSVFDAKALGTSSNVFALEAFKSNPLVAIQHDGDLSRIEDNTRLNSLVSHEMMTVNEKFKSAYTNKFNSFLFMGTNKPVKITDSRSGLLRRLIDVSPTGNRLSLSDYNKYTKQIKFELGAIAYHCKDVFLADPDRYDNYVPVLMLDASNDFFNFVSDAYYEFKKEDGISLKRAWEMYNAFCTEANVQFKLSQRAFKEELKTYFEEYEERHTASDGQRIRSWFQGFKIEKFMGDAKSGKAINESKRSSTINLNSTNSLLDEMLVNCPAQYTKQDESPKKCWDEVETKLSDIDTHQLHYVQVPENLIVIDFDIQDKQGNKLLERNLEEAAKWPETYAELSKSGKGVHLHYIYKGDVSKLSRIYDEHIEIKVFTGKSSLRRKVSLCNDIPVKEIKSGLPLKGDNKMVNFDSIKNERALRTLIKRNLNKEYMGATKPSVDFIYKCLEDAYNNGVKYDVTDLRNDILIFASNSSHQANYCISRVNDMKFRSEEPSDNCKFNKDKIVFYDVEVFPNLFLINWKFEGEGNSVTRMINPSSADVETLLHYKLVGYNCRRYDNHIMYARFIGYSNSELYNLSKRIVSGGSNCFFGEAYNISYTDIYDYASTKQSLKKWEIQLGIHHQELGMPWDQPVPEDKWELVAEYCDNDVIATEAVWNATQADFTARQILADVAGMSVNDTTNSLTTRIIFGNEKKPQSEFNYRDMSDLSDIAEDLGEYEKFDSLGRPIYPGYAFDAGKSMYRDEIVSEGGYVYAEPGIHRNVALLDIASMHPSSVIAENLFGKYTQNFTDIRDARVAIKHKDFDRAKKMLNGKLAKYLTDEEAAGRLAKALKIAINSVYGLTAAGFDNPFRDIRNKDNIVAKRGALFMINLKHRVQELGYTVAHIKTDSIKIPDADQKIIDFVMNYGRKYGYIFEHEDTYEKMCLVNDAVYIAKDSEGWTATGTQFAVPYVFKTLFSREPIEFDDMCETKSVTSALYLDMNEDNPEEHNYVFIGRVGSFTPIEPGYGGGVLVRESSSKYGQVTYASATGAKGYRWLESEMVRGTDKEQHVDKTYYNKLVDDAADQIRKYGDLEEFIS